MTILNITTKISWEIHEQWKSWLLKEHVPAILATCLFERYQFVHLLEMDDDDGPTYALQLYAPTGEQVKIYRKHHLQEFDSKAQKLWGNRMVSFLSVMEVIN